MDRKKLDRAGYRVERIFRHNGFDVFGVFVLTPSRFNGRPVIRFGQEPVAVFGTRERAEAFRVALETSERSR